jgi:hypothetical protein
VEAIKQNSSIEIFSSSSDENKPKRRGRKAVEVTEFERYSQQKIAYWIAQSKDDKLSPKTKRMYRNKASA